MTDHMKVIKTEGKARRGEFVTPHGTVQTPAFMNVATSAAIKGGISAHDLQDDLRCQVMLCNTYHLHVRPGDELVIRTEWPLEHRLEENAYGLTASRLDSMRVDLMAEVRRADGTAGPFLIIDHKCGNYGKFGDDMENLARHLTEAYGQRQSEYIRALHAMDRECQCWLHLPLEGRMLELKLNDGEI